MDYLQVKNYRLFKDIQLTLGITNFFVGDNNIGKTSLLKLIESIFQFDSPNLTYSYFFKEESNTYLSEQTIYNLFYDTTKPLEILICNQKYKNIKKEEEILFEYFKITEFGSTKIPIISEIIAFDSIQKKICKFNLEFYEKFNNKKENKPKLINKIHLETYEFNDIKKFNSSSNKIKELKEILKSQKKKIYEPRIFDADFINNIEKETNIKSPNEPIYMLERFFIRNGLKIDLLYNYYDYYFNKKELKNTKKHSINLSRSRPFEFNQNTKYVKGLRDNFKSLYFISELNENNKTDIESINELTKEKMKNKVEKFLIESQMLDKIDIKDDFITKTNRLVQATYNKNKKEMDLAISGSGVAQVIPVVLSLNNPSISKLFIEQPEIHLHPKAQSILGTHIGNYHIEKFKKNNNFMKQLFIETHSLYIIDSFRHKLYINNKIKNLNNLDSYCSLIFLEESEGNTSIENITILQNGKFRGNIKKFNKFFIDENIRIMDI